MTDLKTQAERLIELNRKRTPGEWEERPWGDGSNHQGFSNVVCDEHELTLVVDTLKEDAVFIAATANHAADIARAYLNKCEEMERLRQALQNIQDITDEREGGSVGQAVEAAHSANEFARQALEASHD